MNELSVEESFYAFDTRFATEAAVLDATKWRFGHRYAHAVNGQTANL